MTIEEEIEWYRDDLEFAALNYARVKSQRFYIDKNSGTRVRFGEGDREMYLKYFREMMERDAEDLLRVISSRPLPSRTNHGEGDPSEK